VATVTLVESHLLKSGVRCRKCGHRMEDPYGNAPLVVICSRCAAEDSERWRQRKLRLEYTGITHVPAVCNCGFLLPDCKAGTCSLLPRGSQRSLF
jgi:ribosomal protein L40E